MYIFAHRNVLTILHVNVSYMYMYTVHVLIYIVGASRCGGFTQSSSTPSSSADAKPSTSSGDVKQRANDDSDTAQDSFAGIRVMLVGR